MKKSFIILLFLFLASLSASAYDFELNDIYYSFFGGNTVKVTYKDNNFNSYSGNVGIPATVTYNGTTYQVVDIGDNAFALCTGLTSVTIPSTVDMIEVAAFFGCSNLRYISIPASVTHVLDYAFYGCENLTSVNCLASTPPDIASTTFDEKNYRLCYLFVPEGSVSAYQAADDWKKFTATKPSLNFALNVSGGEIEFYSYGDYPWMNWADGDRIHAVSGNRSVHNSTSTMSATVWTGEGMILSFDLHAMGEGESYDKCIFSIDGVQQFCYGAHNNGWESYSVQLSAGSHSLIWTYDKDNIINPIGDCFGIDNVRLTKPLEQGDVNADGQVNISDVTALINYVLNENASGINLDLADMNSDGDVNITDVTRLISIVLAYVEPQYYIVGNEPFGGWNPAGGVRMTRQDDGTYTCKATINGTVWFVFSDNLDPDWEVFNRYYRIGPVDYDLPIETGYWFITQKSNTLSSVFYKAYKFIGTGTEYTITLDPYLWLFRID